jgi:hypothetical protein
MKHLQQLRVDVYTYAWHGVPGGIRLTTYYPIPEEIWDHLVTVDTTRLTNIAWAYVREFGYSCNLVAGWLGGWVAG